MRKRLGWDFLALAFLVGVAGCSQKGSVTKDDLKKYVMYQADIARSCLQQCGTDAYVTAFGVVANQLKCDCEKVRVSVKRGKKR